MSQSVVHDEEKTEATGQQTNVEAIAEMMEFSRYGALAQMFIMDALGKQARAVADASPDLFKGDKWENGFVSGEAWQAVAREIAGKLDKHLGK